eukprot:7374195-Prymnesium_polylepis.1
MAGMQKFFFFFFFLLLPPGGGGVKGHTFLVMAGRSSCLPSCITAGVSGQSTVDGGEVNAPRRNLLDFKKITPSKLLWKGLAVD